MLPFDHRPWARRVAAVVVAVTAVAAICIPIILHERKALDIPIMVGIVLLVLAIIPPNIAVIRHRCTPEEAARRQERHSGAAVLASRPTR